MPIGKDLYVFLSMAQSAEDGKLFTLTSNAVRLAFERIRRKAKMNEVRFHDLLVIYIIDREIKIKAMVRNK